MVTYHFAAKDDLISAVIAHVLGSMTEYVQPRLLAAEPLTFPEEFIAAYIGTWVEYFRTHAREVIALVRIYNSFRDEAGRPNPAFDVRADEVTAVEHVLTHGQAKGLLEPSPPGSWQRASRLSWTTCSPSSRPTLTLTSRPTAPNLRPSSIARPAPTSAPARDRAGPGTTHLIVLEER